MIFAGAKRENIIEPATIPPVALFFNKSEAKQLELLKSLLQEENFTQIRKRLQRKGLPQGITALLHGLPGTGKTEAVLQFAGKPAGKYSRWTSASQNPCSLVKARRSSSAYSPITGPMPKEANACPCCSSTRPMP